MQPYQEQYLHNLARIREISGISSVPDFDTFTTQLQQNEKELNRLAAENTQLLREHLSGTLDTLYQADDSVIDELSAFSDQLYFTSAQPDMGLFLHIHNALLLYARRTHNRDLLIKELYFNGMAYYYLTPNWQIIDKSLFKKLHLPFQEAASYLRMYNEIESTETRGYIHRAMGNIAMGYSDEGDEPLKRLSAISASLRVLTDPAYHAKTPDLPWEQFISKTHQERTTLLPYLASPNASPQVVAQVMESTQFVLDQQRAHAEKSGQPMETRWVHNYYRSLFFGGMITAEELLEQTFNLSLSRAPDDYSYSGIYAHLSLPVYFGDTLTRFAPHLLEEKGPQLQSLYARAIHYIKHVPSSATLYTLTYSIGTLIHSFVELEGGYTMRRLLLDLLPMWTPLFYLHLDRTGRLAQFLTEAVLHEAPELLIGCMDCACVKEVLANSHELMQFAMEAGLLHDVGMLYYARFFLTPCRHFLEEESRLMQRHPRVTYTLLEKYPSTSPYKDIALGHHRWYDGSKGYPDPAECGEIPHHPMTDIIALANAFDHALSDTDFDSAITMLRQGRGTRFHPKFTDIFLSHHDALTEQLPSFRQEGLKQLYRCAILHA